MVKGVELFYGAHSVYVDFWLFLVVDVLEAQEIWIGKEHSVKNWNDMVCFSLPFELDAESLEYVLDFVSEIVLFFLEAESAGQNQQG